MESYLEETKAAVAQFRNSPSNSIITVVMGNVSCDLDSAISSLVYAFYKFQRYAMISENVCTKKYRNDDGGKCIVLPVLNIPMEDFELKTEVVHLLTKYNISKNCITFRDQIDLKTLAKNTKLKLILVDHHILPESDKELCEIVTQVIDHRPKDVVNWGYSGDVDTSMECVGSCATLVFLKIFESEFGQDFFRNNIVAAKLLHVTIVLDTVNFSPSAARGTPRDVEAVETLEALLGIDKPTEYRAAVFDEVVRARSDVSRLTAQQLMRKDTKAVGRVLMPGLPMLVEEFLQKPQIQEVLDSTLQSAEVDLILLMGLSIDGENVIRDLALYGGEATFKEQLARHLAEASSPDLQLEARPSPIRDCLLYRQHNVKASRKQILPLVLEHQTKP